MIDVECFANEFNMDETSIKLTARSFVKYSKEKAIVMLFPFSTSRDVNGKLLISSLSLEDRILHFSLCKVILLRIANFTQIVEDEPFSHAIH